MQNEQSSQTDHAVPTIRQTLDDEIYFFQPLQYPSYSRLTFSESPSGQFLELVREAAEETPHQYFHLRTIPETVEVAKVSLELEPPKSMREKRIWLQPLRVDFEFAVYQRHDNITIAFVPNLDLHIVRQGSFDGNFIGQVKQELRNALTREGCMTDLKKLVWVASRFDELTLHASTIPVRIRSPKQVEREADQPEDKESTLKKVALPIERTRLLRQRKKRNKRLPALPQRPKMVECHEALSRLAELLSPQNQKSTLIVGPTGSGKSSLIRELANQKAKYDLSEVEFWETDGSRLVAGMSGYGQWQERCTQLVQELKQKNAVLHLGNLIELLETGKSQSQHEGIASFLKSFIQRGSLLATAECTSEQLAMVEQRDPQLLQVFEQVAFKSPNEPKSLRILRSVADQFATPDSIAVSDESLNTLYRLHRRFATYSDHPGRPIRFLRNLIQDAPANTTIDPESAILAFSQETGLPYFLLSESESLQLQPTRDWFSERVIGQPTPVNLVTDLLATVKSNLTPTGRPIASFLFIGPTGVGKTQMAKSLAEFMYQTDRRLIRFDMSEYRDRVSVERLIGGIGQPQGLLTSKIRQHPFSVVLFDEFEKADRSFFDLLLQVLGEGRLTDGRGKTTDFSTCVVVMTSNLGVASFRTTSTGFATATQSDSETSDESFEHHFTSEVKKFVRPELYNRIDRIVPFMPLSPATVHAVVRRELEQLKQREGIWFHGVQLNVHEQAVELIAQQARDERYGARPIQRYLQLNVAVKLADQLNKYAQSGSYENVVANITRTDNRLSFDIRSQSPGNGNAGEQAVLNSSRGIHRLRSQRRRCQQLYHSSAAQRVRNQYYRESQLLERQLKKLRKKLARQTKTSPSKFAQETTANSIARLEAEGLRDLQPKLDRINELDQLKERVFQIEDEVLTQYFQKQPLDFENLKSVIPALKREIDEATFGLFLAESKGSDTVTLLVYSRYDDLSEQMINAYLQFCQEKSFRVETFRLSRFKQPDPKAFLSLNGPKLETEDKAPVFANVYSVPSHELFHDIPNDRLGFAMRVRGPAAFSMLTLERGAHIFKNVNRRTVAVQAVGGRMADIELPANLLQLKFDEFEVRRTIDVNAELIRDRMEGTIPFRRQDLIGTIHHAMQMSFDQVLANFIKS